MSEGAVRVAVRRLRQQYERSLRETVADTVDDPADVEWELQQLLKVVSGSPPAHLVKLGTDTRETGLPASFSLDGRLFGVAGNCDGAGCAKVWNAADGKDVITIRSSQAVSAPAFTPDGSSIVLSLSDRALHVFDMASATEWLRLVGHATVVTSVVVAPGGVVASEPNGDKA